MTHHFAVTWDYRCPFARNFCEHVLAGLDGGADWDVEFWPFSLDQAHVEEDDPDIWDVAEKAAETVAMQAGIAVRDRFPEQFRAAHRALFAARHDEGLDIRHPEVVRRALSGAGVDGDAVLEEVSTGAHLETFRKEHEFAVAEHAVFGVPTVVLADRAAFVRVMHRPHDDPAVAIPTVERVLDLVGGWSDLNELKHTKIPR